MRCRPDLSRSTGWRNRPAAPSVVLVARGYVADGSLTDAGDDALARLREARRERLAERLNGWSPERHEELGELLRRLARDLPPDRAAVV